MKRAQNKEVELKEESFNWSTMTPEEKRRVKWQALIYVLSFIALLMI
jgi:predicted Fe-S protein YdhL (DUF1289 family)